jgi:hypothetical protein
VAIVVQNDWDVSDRSTANYDHVSGRIAEGGPIPGLHFHSAGFADDRTWRVIDVWETQADCDRFMQERLMPLLSELPEPGGGPPDRVTSWELHAWQAG